MDCKYKLLGAGSYGCVYKPPLKCKNIRKLEDIYGKMDNNVLKIVDKSSMDEELELSDLLYEIDPTQEYFIYNLPDVCQIDMNDNDNIDALDNCPLSHLNNPIGLIQKYGGQSLFDYFKENPNISLSKLIQWLYKLLIAVLKLLSIDYVHFDIRDDNILIDRKENVSIIDFGLTYSLDDLINFTDDVLSEFIASSKRKSSRSRSSRSYYSSRISSDYRGCFYFHHPIWLNSLRNCDVSSVDKKSFDESYLVDIKDLLSKSHMNIDAIQENIQELVPKIDVFSIGLVFFDQMIYRMDKLEQENKALYRDFYDLLVNMIHPNAFKQFDIYKSLKGIYKLSYKYNINLPIKFPYIDLTISIRVNNESSMHDSSYKYNDVITNLISRPYTFREIYDILPSISKYELGGDYNIGDKYMIRPIVSHYDHKSDRPYTVLNKQAEIVWHSHPFDIDNDEYPSLEDIYTTLESDISDNDMPIHIIITKLGIYLITSLKKISHLNILKNNISKIYKNMKGSRFRLNKYLDDFLTYNVFVYFIPLNKVNKLDFYIKRIYACRH
jgi:serine/threonine protein kinase